MLEYLLSAGMLAQAALFFYGAGFVVRDELILRGLILIGTGFYIAYYWVAADQPLWDAIFASLILGMINVVLCVIIMLERTTFAMSPIMADAYRGFPTLSPGQFRKIFKSAKVVTLDEDRPLLQAGRTSNAFYRALSGTLSFQKEAQFCASFFYTRKTFPPAAILLTIFVDLLQKLMRMSLFSSKKYKRKY